MKERYFTHENIDEKARDLLHTSTAGQKTRKISYQPGQSALLVLDMQSYFLDPSSHAYIPSSEAILNRIKNLIGRYYSCNLPVVFTRHINTPDNARLMATWWRETISIENPLSQITDDLDYSRGIVLEKSQYDAFLDTHLDEILKGKGIKQVVISGVMTHLCCETTARSAFMRGLEVFFLVDGTATYNEAFHAASLTNLAHGFAEITLASDIALSLQGESNA